MSARYNHIVFMQHTAEKLKEIAHKGLKRRFFISTGLAALEGLIANLSSAHLPCLVAEDNSDERLSDNLSDNIMGTPFYAFYILYPAAPGNDQKILEARKNAKTAAKKVISRMLHLRHDPNLGLDLVDYNSVRFLGVGPLGDSAHGVMVSFSLLQPADITYNPDDWTGEES